MQIQLNDKYRISGIPLNYSLEEKKVAKEGEKAGTEYWINVGYYPDIDWLVYRLLNKEILENDLQSVQEIKAHLHGVMEQITALIKKVDADG